MVYGCGERESSESEGSDEILCLPFWGQGWDGSNLCYIVPISHYLIQLLSNYWTGQGRIGVGQGGGTLRKMGVETMG